MPELPEVETVKNTLKNKIAGKKIKEVTIYWDNIIIGNKDDFIKKIINETIKDIKRRGKWLIFELNNYYLLSHLRMEGKYFFKNKEDIKEKHEHVIFTFSDNSDLRYHDTRKFGKMRLVDLDDDIEKYIGLGHEPWDNQLDDNYLLKKYKNKNKEIKTVLLDQTIIAGIGNIYADEILFQSRINPYKKAKDITKEEARKIILETRNILKSAIKLGGTTIRTYTSSLGVSGSFQQNLFVHTMSECKLCLEPIKKVKIGGRGTYYCPKCQSGEVLDE